MRTLVVCLIASLDGRSAGPGGDVMALPFDGGFSAYNAERLRAASTLLLGRRTYEGFAGYWPGVAHDPGAPPVEREISRLNTAMEKVVVSDTLELEPDGPWTPTTRVVRRAGAHAAVGELKRAGEGEVLVFGSRTLWNDLLAAGLVDELHVMTGPSVLGAGDPLYDGPTSVPLRLLEARRLPASDLVLTRHAPD